VYDSNIAPLVGLGPPGFPAHFGAANNPIQIVNNDFGQGYPSNALGFNLVGPVEMVVESDEWSYCQGCTTTVARLVTYKVVNSDGSPAANIPLGEVNDYGSSNCTQGRPAIRINSCTVATNQNIPNPSGGTNNVSGGMWATDENGEFTDQWTMGSDGYAPVGCGFAVNYDHWQLCGLSTYFGSANTGLTFATLTGTYYNNDVGVTIGGGHYFLPEGAVPDHCPPNNPNCRNAIPTGTVVTP